MLAVSPQSVLELISDPFTGPSPIILADAALFLPEFARMIQPHAVFFSRPDPGVQQFVFQYVRENVIRRGRIIERIVHPDGTPAAGDIFDVCQGCRSAEIYGRSYGLFRKVGCQDLAE